MESPYVITLADERANLETVGGKGASLARLSNAGVPVPPGFHVSTAAYEEFVAENHLQPVILQALANAAFSRPESLEAASRTIQEHFAQGRMPDGIASAIAWAYEELPGEHPVVAVRSSATAEDLPGLSFAGQQETFLNIHGLASVQEAVQRCWASLWTARAIGYRAQHSVDQEAVRLAVVVQVLVPAEASGILFTANPVTGQRDQAVVSASWGLGEAVVGGLVTPDTFTVEKASGKVLNRDIADKQVMTVLLESNTAEHPVPETMRRAPSLSDAQVSELFRLGAKIEELYQIPMDIEWALAEGQLAIVQARPITALPEPESALPTDWRLPHGVRMAMRNNIVELMAEPLTPLFGTLGRSAINTSLGRLLAAFFGRADLTPEEIIVTVNQYAYYNGSMSPGQIGRILLRSFRIMKRMFSGAVERWTDVAYPRYVATVESWQTKRWRDLPATELLSAARELSEAAIDAYGALVGGVIPAAWISEGLFTLVYKRLIKRRDDPPASFYLLGYDSAPIQGEKALYDLAQWARVRGGLAAFLLRTPAIQVLTQGGPPPSGVEEGDWREFQNRFQSHLRRYGHAIYNLDFANPVAVDDPGPLLETCKLFLAGQGTNPYARQQATAERRERATQAILSRLKGLRRRLFCKFLAPAQKYAPLREDGLADVGLSYPLLRRMLGELGRRFAAGGMIDKVDDIYWLTQDEVEEAAARLDRGEDLSPVAAIVPQRKAAWRAARRVSPPRALPQMRLGGRRGVESPKGRGRIDDVIKGVAASPGSVTATARVIHGPEDFARMRPGDVLVASITTPAWTPLFAMAAGVVTDVGGPLSHGSIVAREYGIPAVLGTGCATQRIADGQTITVDGTAGRVRIEAPGAAWPLPDPKGHYMRASICELMPDPLTPLFATLGLTSIDDGIDVMAADLMHMPPGSLSGVMLTIRGYAYERANFTARQWYLLVTRMILRAPRLLRQGVPYWRTVGHPRYVEVVMRWRDRPTEHLLPGEIWAGVREIVAAFAQHLGSLMASTMGPSAGSEGLFTQVYEKMVRRPGDPSAPTFLMGFDSLPIKAEKALYDLGAWCREQDALAAYLADAPASQVAAKINEELSPDGVPYDVWDAYRSRFQQYLRDYGYSIYDMDFAKPLPSDDPEPILETLKLFITGQSKDPYERQKACQERREAAVQAVRSRLRGLKRWAFEKTLRWAQSQAPLREDGIVEIGLGYPELRRMLLELGHRFAGAGAFRQAEDIFWLEAAEVEAAVAALERGDTLVDHSGRVEERKALWQTRKRLAPPAQLPVGKKYMGLNVEGILAVGDVSQEGNTIKGVPTSPGQAKGTARVLLGPEDFDQMQPGDILVASITTPAWTPLFTMASAVVTDIGGPLSHGSIVAREFGIPAVLGTGVATHRIASGQTITVDGNAGLVLIGNGHD